VTTTRRCQCPGDDPDRCNRPFTDSDLRTAIANALAGEDAHYCGPGYGTCGYVVVQSAFAPALADAALDAIADLVGTSRDGVAQALRATTVANPTVRTLLRDADGLRAERDELKVEVGRLRMLLQDILYDHEWRLVDLVDGDTYRRMVTRVMYEGWRKEAGLDGRPR
jgi:hypothetical protein